MSFIFFNLRHIQDSLSKSFSSIYLTYSFGRLDNPSTKNKYVIYFVSISHQRGDPGMFVRQLVEPDQTFVHCSTKNSMSNRILTSELVLKSFGIPYR